MTNEQEIWQVDVNGQIYETSFEGLLQWINEGSLLPHDKVRRGNLRWLEAGKTSQLYGFFNAKELGIAPPIVFTANVQAAEKTLPIKTENVVTTNIVSENSVVETTATETPKENLPPKPPLDFNPDTCAIHADVPPIYVCGCCAHFFCKACPHSYSSVKICPFCGELCRLITVVATKEKPVRPDSDKLSFTDFTDALAYPFRFPASLILGAIMFMFFTLGQSASAIGGLYLLSASIFCALLANTLTFGILANTVENMAQGKTDLDFMPRFDDFSIWDDVVHPFFLSIGVYLVSFGFFLILLLGAVWYAASSISGALPDAQKDLNSAVQIPNPAQSPNQNSQNPPINNEEAEFQRVQEMINQSRKAQMESVVGKSPAEEKAASQQIAIAFLKTAGLFLIPMFFALLWGLFYFPAACAVAGYTRSFTAVINPLVGLDTIKHLGLDYVKILLIGLVLAVFTFIVSLILGIIFSSFDLPRLGNLPVAAVASFFHFYFWIVFSIILGFALYKNSARLKLFQGSRQ